MEGNLAFTAPTVNQFRNPHTLMKDFLDEDDLYKRAGDLVHFLIDWKPSADVDLPTMMVELAKVWLSGSMPHPCLCSAGGIGHHKRCHKP